MPEVVISTLDTRLISAQAVKLMKAAVLYAEENRETSSHTISLTDFCEMAGLPATPHFEFLKLVESATKVVALVETVDTLSADRDDLPFMCWSVFKQVTVDRSYFSFAISDRTFGKSMMDKLLDL